MAHGIDFPDPDSRTWTDFRAHVRRLIDPAALTTYIQKETKGMNRAYVLKLLRSRYFALCGKRFEI